MTKKTRIRDYDQFIVRLPDGMRDSISHAADQNARSMNAEIVARLEQSFDPSLMSEEMAEQVEALHQCESALKNTRDELAKANEIRELLGKYVEATERQNEALRKAGVAGEPSPREAERPGTCPGRSRFGASPPTRRGERRDGAGRGVRSRRPAASRRQPGSGCLPGGPAGRAGSASAPPRSPRWRNGGEAPRTGRVPRASGRSPGPRGGE